jgi:hypothetical protein
MQHRENNNQPKPERAENLPRQSRGLPWIRTCAAVLFVSAALPAAQQTQQNGQQSSNSQPPVQAGPDRAWTSSPQLVIPEVQAGQQNFDAANVERRKQIADDSARLLKLATDLKTEVDKTTKDTLSLNVIRKADEIEKLAHSVKEKMKLTAGTN